MRRFEYLDDKSAKFWEIEQLENDLNIRWGRIGTTGQSQTKNFADATKAGAALVKLVNEKTGKGYVELAVEAGATIGTAPVKQAPASTPAQTQVAAGAPDLPETPIAPARPAAPAAPAETIDQQIERGFEVIRAQIADATLAADSEITPAKVRRSCGISELAAGQVFKQLDSAGLISAWRSTVNSQARETAIAIADRRSAPAPVQPARESTGESTNLAPWLAQGEPLRLGGPADDIRRRARPTRRHPHTLEAIDAQRTWLQVRTHIGAEVAPDYAGTDGALREAFEAAWRSRDNRKMPDSPQTDAVLLALCMHQRRYYQRRTVDDTFIDYLVARHGLPYAIDALLEAMSYYVNEDYIGKGANPISLCYRAALAPQHQRHHALHDGEWRLRAHLACAPQDIYDVCAAKVRESMAMVVPDYQVALAMLFPDRPDMTHELIERLCASGAKPPPAVHWLQLNATDPTALAQARKVKNDSYGSLWSDTNLVATLLLEHRLDAVRWLAPGAAQEEAGDALARIGTPEALDALARVAGSAKPALARFNLAVERWPVAAVVALARVLAGNSRDQGLLMPTLVELVRRHPSLPADLQPWLEPAANNLLETVRARLAGPADVAGGDELPDVLVNVPWLQVRKKSAQVLQLIALPLAPVERWDEGEKDALIYSNSWRNSRYDQDRGAPEGIANYLGFESYRSTPEQNTHLKAARAAIAQGNAADLIATWRAMLADKKKERWYYYTLDGHAVAHLPPQLGLPLWNAAACEASCSNVEYVAAKWGMAAFPGILARIGSAPAENLATALHFGAIELAPIAARAFAKLKTLRAAGRAWLKRFPEHAACALIAPAVGKPNEARDCAATSLRYLASIGHTALLEEVAGRYGKPEVLAALHAVLSESALDRYPNKRAALPEFWKPGGWSRPQLHNGKALDDAALDVMGTMMAFPTTEEVYAGLDHVKQACTPATLADFAWDCFSAWLNAGAPSKDGWALTSLGLFGTDDTARKLTPLIRAWPGEAAHARAVTGLDVLAAIGSDVALMLLNGIAQKVKFKGLQDKAREKIETIAQARGLSAEELEDRLAPDLGLDEHGSMVLEFGPRAYKVGFDEALKPYVREWKDDKAGARLPDLPKPKKTDDEQLAKEATERFKLLKKDARTIASQQVLRLEVAMCARRRWSPSVFAQFMANHPLVRHLVRRLVWGVYAMPIETFGEGEDQESRVASYGGELQACFRVSEDGEYTTAGDDPFVVPEGEQINVGLPHALELPADQAAAFGQLLADYELLQPFAQLGRDTYTLTDEERRADRLLRWKDVKVPTGKVLGLANIGWRRGAAEDGGSINNFDKAADAGRTLELLLDPGIIVGMVDEYPEQTLGEITLAGSGYRWGQNGKLATFDTLDAIASSELIRDMQRLCS